MALTTTAALAACTGQSDDGKPGRTDVSASAAPAPSWKPLEHATEAEEVPPPLAASPAVDDVDAEERTRRAGESFALNAARLLMDVRTPGSSGKVIDSMASTTMSAPDRTYAARQLEEQRDLGRLVDGSVEQWVRSRTVPDRGEPGEVEAEVAFNMSVPAIDHRLWTRIRVNAVWEDGRWRLLGFSEGPTGPNTSANLTAAQRRDYLDGAGWRRIVPAR